MTRHLLIYIFSLLILLSSESHSYNGDGKLIDSGPTSATERYVLDLGEINLGTDKEYTFKIRDLPATNFVFGINLVSEKINGIDFAENIPINAKIEFLILNNENEILLDDSAYINKWVWSQKRGANSAFGYRRINGKSGTYFTPSKGASYTVKLKISETDGTGNKYNTKLLAKSGGWK